MILLSIFWYYHDIMILSWYLKISRPFTPTHIQANIWALLHLDTFKQPFDIMISLSIFWYYHDISQYQALKHFVTSSQTFVIIILISIFWQYHDILILSWYLKISSPYTISHIQANIWYYNIDINILIY